MKHISVAMLCILALLLLVNSASAQSCAVDVYGPLTVRDSTIEGYIRNTGNASETINYTIYVDDSLVKSASLELNASESQKVTKTHSFGYGIHTIKLNATADCGANDSETMIRIILEGYACSDPYGLEGQERCDYTTRQFLRCEGGDWDVIATDEDEYCYNCAPLTCGDRSCNCGETISSCYQDCRVGPCISDLLNNYRCYGSWRQREYQYANCTKVWLNITECMYGCSNGFCNTAPGVSPGCGIAIKTFDYLDQVVPGGVSRVTATVKNTGDSTEIISLGLYIDDELKGFRSLQISSGSESTEQLVYTLPSSAGSYQMVLNVTADCGSYDRRQATLHVIETISPGPSLPPQPTAPIIPPKETDVSFYPTSLDMTLYSAKVVAVDIESAEDQIFTITASGIASEWLEYDETVQVSGERIVYIYVTPKDLGSYNLTVSARAESEGLDFSSRINLYVAPPGEEVEEGFFGKILKRIGEIIYLISNNFWVIVSLIIIVFIVVLALGARKFRTEHWPLK